LKLYYYKIKINNNIYKTYQIEQLIKEQTKLKNTVSRYCYQGVDTGIFFITTTQKIKRSKRIIKIKNKTFRIECMNNEEINNYEVNWKEIGIRKQEKSTTCNVDNLSTQEEEEEEEESESNSEEEDDKLILKSKNSKLIVENVDKVNAKANPRTKSTTKYTNEQQQNLLLPKPIESTQTKQITNTISTTNSNSNSNSNPTQIKKTIQ